MISPVALFIAEKTFVSNKYIFIWSYVMFYTLVGELNLQKWSNRSLHCKSLKFLSQADMT